MGARGALPSVGVVEVGLLYFARFRRPFVADQIDIELSTDVGRFTIPRPVFSSRKRGAP